MKIISSVLLIIGAIRADVHELQSQGPPFLFELPQVLSNHLSFDGTSASAHHHHEYPQHANQYEEGDTYEGYRVAKKFTGPVCPQNFAGTPPNCRATQYLLEPVPTEPPTVHCPLGQYFNGNKCVPRVRTRCQPPNDHLYEPYCTATTPPPACYREPTGPCGVWPHCHACPTGPPTPRPHDCSELGLVGYYPNCHQPCELYCKYI